MKSKRFFAGILVLTFGLIIIGCDNGSTPTDSESGRAFTITGLLEYNGKYVKAYGEGTNSDYIIAAKGNSDIRDNYFLLIEGDSAAFPTLYDEDDEGNLTPTVKTGLFKFEVDIYLDTSEASYPITRKTFPSVSITNGKGAVSWANGE
jgi:hypothetical protein